MQSPFIKTKVIATVGPACSQKEKLLELVQAGANVFRLNFSHGKHSEHLEVINSIRELNKEHNMNICILQDLQGPKIRIREVENGSIELVEGEIITITTQDEICTSKRLSTVYEALPKDVKIGDSILIDDGKIELLTEAIENNEIIAKIIYGGTLTSKKGINLPNTIVSAPSLTSKDTEDLMFGLEHEVDWIALSFVRTAIDLLLLKHLIRQQGKNCKVVAKVEKPEAIRNIDEIISVADAVMVARGDLGVELGIEQVPMAQKMIVQKCLKASKPVIIATQMLESMISNPRPTRAETNDIANAVIDGADTLMLSAETAVGKYPALVIKTMRETIRIVEDRSKDIYHKNYDLDQNSESFYSDSVVATACILAKDTDAKAIIGMTNSGYTAYKIASHRPKADIFIFTSNKVLLNIMGLIWGVRVFYYDKFISTDETFQDIQNFLVDNDYLVKGDIYINLASMPIHRKQRTNMLKLSVVE